MRTRQLFRIKICGITRAEDATAAARAGADAIGLNFYAQSRRYVSIEHAARIVEHVGDRTLKVGVFVNDDADRIRRITKAVQLDWVQLHGDEPPRLLQLLHDVNVIRAFRCRESNLGPVRDYLAACEALGRCPDAVLLDAWHPDEFGGTGKSLDWERLRDEIASLDDIPWILAGGLRPSNVAEAILRLGPNGVDTASGVESTPGVKDPQQVIQFVQTALAAWNDGRAGPRGDVNGTSR